MLACRACGTIAVTRADGEIERCTCGGQYFVTMEKANWKLTVGDREFLKQMRIDGEG